MKQDLRKIDVDFIRELRGEGRSFEANELLRAYYKDVKKAGKNALYDECKHCKSDTLLLYFFVLNLLNLGLPS